MLRIRHTQRLLTTANDEQDTECSSAVSGYANGLHAHSSSAQLQRETRFCHRLQRGSDFKHDPTGKLGRRPHLNELSRRGESMQIGNRFVGFWFAFQFLG